MPDNHSTTSIVRRRSALIPSPWYQAWMEWPDEWAQLTHAEVMSLPWTPRERQQIQQLWWFLDDSLNITE